MPDFPPGESGLKGSAPILSHLFLQGKLLSMPVGGRSLYSTPQLATDMHTDAHFNKFKLNLSRVCHVLRFPNRIIYSPSTNIIYIKEYIEQRVKYGGRGLPAAYAPAYPHSPLHLRPSQNIKGASATAYAIPSHPGSTNHEKEIEK
jgi:hypothetical protein